MDIKIRLAAIGDSDDICRINADDLGYDFPLERARKKLSLLLESPSDRIFVAEADGALSVMFTQTTMTHFIFRI